MNIDILIATYNPNLAFLEKQIVSITKQEYDFKLHSVHVMIYDDGSNNQSEVLQLLNLHNTDSWDIVTNKNNVGFLRAFNNLIAKSTAELIFFCDQDDIWDNSKLSSFIEKYNQIKKKELPTVLFSDVQCIDENDNLLNLSHLNHMGYNRAKNESQFFLKNYVPGCSLAFNKPAKNIYISSENYIGLHDYLLILIAIIYGSLIFIDKTTMSYRFHRNNTIAKYKRSFKYVVRDMANSFKYSLFRKKYHKQHAKLEKKQLKYFFELNASKYKKNHLDEYQIIKKIETSPYSYNFDSFISGGDFGEFLIEKILFSKIL